MFETALDSLNKNFRNYVINVYTVPTIFDSAKLTGCFLEADETGVWILSYSKDKVFGNKCFFYHEKIVKIEQVEKIDIGLLPEEQKREILDSIQRYERKRKEEVEEMVKATPQAPDVPDPNDHEKVYDSLERVRKIILENKEGFLEDRN